MTIETLGAMDGEQPSRRRARAASVYRLAWFQHVHKCAGTSIVQMARLNGEVLYPHHANGTPLDEGGRLLPLWQLDAEALRTFVDDCERRGVTFLSTERGLPDVAALRTDARVVLVTCLRDPLERFLSDFYYALHNGFSHSRTHVWDAVGTTFYKSPNYYCRLFSRMAWYEPGVVPEEDVTERHFLLARANLEKFHCAFMLEGDPDFSMLRRCLGWRGPIVHANRMDHRVRRLMRSLRFGQYRSAWRQVRYGSRRLPPGFVDWFATVYRWDRALVEAVKTRAHEPTAHAWAPSS
jgi:hypothetical protein